MALGNETNKRPGDDGWYPQILFEPQVQGPRNRSAEEDVVPTPYYDTRTMPKFRVNPAPGDMQGLDDEEPSKQSSGSGWQQEAYGYQSGKQAGNAYINPTLAPKTVFGGRPAKSQNPQPDRSK